MSADEPDIFGLDIEHSWVWRLLKNLIVWVIGA